MWDKLKKYLGNAVTTCTIIFVSLYICAWIGNGYFGTHFSLNDLTNIYQLLIPKIAQHWIDSNYNSKPGEPPVRSVE